MNTTLPKDNFSLQDMTQTFEGVTYREEWKWISGYRRLYQISSFGRVKSFNRLSRDVILLKWIENRWGYYAVGLYNSSGVKRLSIHRLVAIHFIPNPLNKPKVNHESGIKWLNSFFELSWATQKENIDHAINTGLSRQKGEDHPNAILTNSEAVDIYNSSLSRQGLAQKYKVDIHLINSIKQGRTYFTATGAVYRKKLARLSKNKVISIFKDSRDWSKIAAYYGVRYNVIYGIKTGSTYSNITGKTHKRANRKLTEQEILSIYNSNGRKIDLMKTFGVGTMTVWRIQNGKIYSKITNHCAIIL